MKCSLRTTAGFGGGAIVEAVTIRSREDCAVMGDSITMGKVVVEGQHLCVFLSYVRRT